MKKSNQYDINLYYPEDGDDSDLVVALYQLYIDQDGHLTTWTEEVYDAVTASPSSNISMAKATFGIDMLLEGDAWDCVSPTTPLPPETAPKLRAMLRDLPAYNLYDRRDEN